MRSERFNLTANASKTRIIAGVTMRIKKAPAPISRAEEAMRLGSSTPQDSTMARGAPAVLAPERPSTERPPASATEVKRKTERVEARGKTIV